MAHLRASVVQGRRSGFDGGRNLLVLSAGGSTDLYLVAGDNLSPQLTGNAATVQERKPSQAECRSPELTGWEREMGIRAFTFRGVTPGDATFRACSAGTTIDTIAPLTVRVAPDREHRQAGEDSKGKILISAELRLELQGMPFREALIRLAEDQMHSAIGTAPHGGSGRYGLAKGAQWCGAFVHWLHKRVAEIQGADNPFGDNVNTLASPQKAIGFALHRPDDFTILRFSGADPYGWSWPEGGGKPVADKTALKAEYQEITPASGPPHTGDICLVRVGKDPASGWKHVCMVLTPPGEDGRFLSFDGNQGGSYNPTTGRVNGSIGINERDANVRVDGVYKHVFITTPVPRIPRTATHMRILEQVGR